MDPESRILVERYEQGDVAAAKEIYERYALRLIGLARRILPNSVAKRVDPEDVVQSAYRSFFIRARDGTFTLRKRGDLWRLLAAITRHKAHHQVDRQHAAKRATDKESNGDEFVVDVPSPAEVASLAEELHLALGGLPDDERRVLELRLQDQSAASIATEIGKSPRTVRRMLLSLRHKLEKRVRASDFAALAGNVLPPRLDRNASLDHRHFRLEQMVGAGGFGKVYRAFWTATEQTVAVKALRKQLLLDRRAVESFVAESEIVSHLRHPGIIRSHGLGRTPAGGYFLVLDWCAGGNLQSQTVDSPVTIARWLQQAAEAVAYLHAAGIVHCDLKPSNLLLDANGRVVVTDFGFACGLQRDSAHAIGGTLEFLAPEILAGEKVTPACDVYSLGVILRGLIDRCVETNAVTSSLLSIADACSKREPRLRLGSAEVLANQLRSLVAAQQLRDSS